MLQGEGVTLVLDGKTEINNGHHLLQFETVARRAVHDLRNELPGGPALDPRRVRPKHARYDLCGANLAMPTEIIGQNGAVLRQTTKITTERGCPPAVSITKTAVKGNAPRVTVNLAIGGTVTITGKGLKTTAKRDVKAGTRTITVPLTNVRKAATQQKRKLKIEATQLPAPTPVPPQRLSSRPRNVVALAHSPLRAREEGVGAPAGHVS